MTTTRDGVEIRYVSEEEAWHIVDDAAQRELGMNAREFIHAWDSGKFDDDPDRPEIMHVVALLGLLPNR